MEHLERALESGKRRGYDEVRDIESISYLFQYAIKKEMAVYSTYFMKVDESKLDVFEDYAEEEIRAFHSLEAALEYLKIQGADPLKLSPIKRTLPF